MSSRRHVAVLHWHESINRDPLRREVPDVGPQVFVADATERVPYSVASGLALRLEYDTWQDMGGPTVITVTVEPGDLTGAGQ